MAAVSASRSSTFTAGSGSVAAVRIGDGRSAASICREAKATVLAARPVDARNSRREVMRGASPRGGAMRTGVECRPRDGGWQTMSQAIPNAPIRISASTATASSDSPAASATRGPTALRACRSTPSPRPAMATRVRVWERRRAW